MTRVGFQLKIKEDKIEEYIEHHKNVWPEMLAALSESGWRNYSLFMREDGVLFGYFETPAGREAASARMAEKEINTKWQQFMAPYFEAPDSSRPDKISIELREVFHLD